MNRAVDVSRGLKKFIFYVFLSGVLGFVTNLVIQQKLQKVWAPIAEKLRQAGLESSVPRMVYTRTGLPVFGARIDQVRFEKDFKCFRGTVSVDDVFVPFSFYQLLSQKVKLGKVDVQKLRVEFIEQEDCERSIETIAAAEVESIEQVASKVVSRALKKAGSDVPDWFGHLDKWFLHHGEWQEKNPLTSLVIRELSLEARSLVGKQMTAQGHAEFDFKDKLSAAITLKPLLLRKKEKSLTTEFRADLVAGPENVHIFGDWGFHEGHVTLNLNYTRQENIKIDFASKDLPLSALNKWLDTSWSFQFLWFNCGVGIETQKDQWADAFWSLSHCQMNSPAGTITLLDEKVDSLKKPKELTLEIQKMDLDKIVHGRGNIPLSGVFKGFGELQGRVELRNEKLSADLELSQAQVVFSSHNHRELQSVEKMKFQAAYASNVYSLSLVSADILNGRFQGSISAEYNDRLAEGRGKVRVQALSFDDEIEDLMLAGQVAPVAVNGDFELGPGWRLTKAQARMDVPQFRGKNVDLDQGVLLLDWTDELLRGTATVAQVKVLRSGDGQWMLSSLLDKAPEKDLPLSRVHGQAKYADGVYTLDKLVGDWDRWRLEVGGTYSKNGAQGSWVWQEQGKLFSSWKWISAKRMHLIPQSPETRSWLEGHRAFLSENPSVTLNEKDI